MPTINRAPHIRLALTGQLHKQPRRVRRIYFLQILLLALLTAITSVVNAETGFKVVKLDLKGRTYQLEIARTALQKSRGLMYREQLKSEQGMLFVYQRDGDYRIWMKNTLIPLTVIWLDNEARIIERRLLQPCRRSPCPSYGANLPARYIVEFSADQYSQFEVGDTLPEVITWQQALQR